jgi:transposase
VLEGVSRSEAAGQNGMDRQTLCDWVRRYNDLGIEGLKSGSRSGRKPSLNGAQKAELLALAVKGPDLETDRVVRWRCVDLRDEVKRRFSVTVHENTIGVWLREMKLTRLQPRPFHPKKDPPHRRLLKQFPRADRRGPAASRCRQADRGLVPEPALGRCHVRFQGFRTPSLLSRLRPLLMQACAVEGGH